MPRPYCLHAPLTYRFPQDDVGLLAWAHAEERLREARRYWLTTVRADGRPHATPLWGVWLEGALYFDGLPTTTWGRNLADRSEVTLHVEDGADTVILEGSVEDLTTDTPLGQRIADAWTAKYGRLAPDAATCGVFRLRPRRARAWSREDLTDGTGWTFPRE